MDGMPETGLHSAMLAKRPIIVAARALLLDVAELNRDRDVMPQHPPHPRPDDPTPMPPRPDPDPPPSPDDEPGSDPGKRPGK
jgi:hypothetical protein